MFLLCCLLCEFVSQLFLSDAHVFFNPVKLDGQVLSEFLCDNVYIYKCVCVCVCVGVGVVYFCNWLADGSTTG